MAEPTQLVITPADSIVEANNQITFAVEASGLLASVNGNFVNWQNLDGCSVLVGGALQDSSGGADGFGVSGATSTESIAAGEGYVDFVANVPVGANPFGGRQFYAGLTTNSAVDDISEIQFAINVFEGGVLILEGGVEKRNARAPRNNGVYRIGIEDGAVVYRADGEVIYRSDQTITYPLRLGAIFSNRNVDWIGGVPSNEIFLQAEDVNGNPAGSFSAGTWTAPATRGRYKITAYTSNYLYGTAYASVLERFPDIYTSNIRRPNKFLALPAEWKINEQVFDDQSADYNLPFETELRRWRLEWNRISEADAKILDDFYERHKSKAYQFYFFDYRAAEGVGILYDNARITKYERDHARLWAQKRIVEVTNRPR